MKFKALFLTFNIVLFLSFLTIILLPFFIMDGGFMFEFWANNWFFGFIFLCILGIVNGVFLSHWKMLSFLENEDWPGLSQYLENRVLVKKIYRKRYIALLCDSLILLGDFATIMTLADRLRSDRPKLLALLGVKFAAAALLAGDPQKLHSLASSLVDQKGADRDWLAFYASFSRHLAKDSVGAASGFTDLARSARDPLVTAVSGYLCSVLSARQSETDNSGLSTSSSEARQRICGKFTRAKWKAYVDEAKAEMHVVVLGKLIEQTEAWVFAEEAA